jgi:hypothetical protein
MQFHNSDSLYRVFCETIRFHYCRTYKLLEKIGLYPGQHPLLFSLAEPGTHSIDNRRSRGRNKNLTEYLPVVRP